MTEEQLRIARNTYDEMVHAKQQYQQLKRLLDKPTAIYVALNETNKTYLSKEEISFLNELCEFRKEHIAALEKEFANL